MLEVVVGEGLGSDGAAEVDEAVLEFDGGGGAARQLCLVLRVEFDGRFERGCDFKVVVGEGGDDGLAVAGREDAGFVGVEE